VEQTSDLLVFHETRFKLFLFSSTSLPPLSGRFSALMAAETKSTLPKLETKKLGKRRG
jgi:hypothetical protein